MTKEESIKRLESIKETYETFAHGLDDIHLDIEALEYAIENLKDKQKTNKEKIGHWIFVKRCKYPSMCGDWICSRCKTTTAECVRKDNKWAIPTYKYCPLCGIKMEVIDD